MHRQTNPSRQLPSRYSGRVQEESHIQGTTSVCQGFLIQLGIETNSVLLIHAPCLLPCWNLGGPGGTSWFGSTGGSGVRVSNCSLLIIFTFLKFSTSCCIGRGR